MDSGWDHKQMPANYSSRSGFICFATDRVRVGSGDQGSRRRRRFRLGDGGSGAVDLVGV